MTSIRPPRACELCGRTATAYRNCRGIMRHCCAACYTDERRRASDELAAAAAQDPRWRRVLAREGRAEAGPPPPVLARYWQRVHHADPRALAMADRHYSRQSPGTPEFIPAGHKIVLMHVLADGTPAALWASHRPAPNAALARPRFDGLDVWDCALFRVEQRTALASDLIREAVAITRGLWEPLPRDGFYTTINPAKVAPIKVRGRETWGYCYVKAGWQLQAARTKARNLIVLMLPLNALARIDPIVAPLCAPPFGVAWRRWARKHDDRQAELW